MTSGRRLWGGRFSGPPARAVSDYTDSLSVDRRLYREDIKGSIAHARMLGAAGIIPAAEAQQLVKALGAVRRELDEGTFEFLETDEDIHTAVERRLHETIGPDVAGKLHTGRSRNDQVALDMRLFTRHAIYELGTEIARLQVVFINLATAHRDALMPAYTHLQRAQPSLLAHHLLAYVAMLQRDFERLSDAYDRADVMPLGSGAATGTGLPLNREMVAKELGFTSLTQNSLDAVSDRDFVVETEAACALIMVHLSRLAEEIVLWSSSEFGFLELSDDFATGSSLMPQKKNPDVAELVRGRSGRVFGNLLAMLTTLKGLPLSYNRDLQEDKAGYFDAVDTTLASLDITGRLLARARFNVATLEAAAADPAMLATELADYLVRKGVPFRTAHELVGKAVRKAQSRKVSLAGLGLEYWKELHEAFDDDVAECFDPRQALQRRRVVGSAGAEPVKRAMARAALAVRRNRAWLTANKPSQ